MIKRFAAVALVLTLALVLVPISAQTQTKMNISISSVVGVTTISIAMPDSVWAEVQAAYVSNSGTLDDPQSFALNDIAFNLVGQFNGQLEAANTKVLTDATPPSQVKQ